MSAHRNSEGDAIGCWPDCNHRHKHRADCKHGTPTAHPQNHRCSVCGDAMAYRYCPLHFAWECARHAIGTGSGHVLDNAAAALV
jgi:hypothetical protein